MNIFNNPTKYLKEILSKVQIKSPKKLTGKSMAVVFLTKICPVGCPFCFFRSSKETNHTFVEEQEFTAAGEKKLISVLNNLNLEILEISGGGEPFEKFDTLLNIVKNVNVENIEIVTSGYWATNYHITRKILQDISNALQGQNRNKKVFLRISIDKFHLRHVKIENIYNIIKVFEDNYLNFDNFTLQFHTIENDESIDNIIKIINANKNTYINDKKSYQILTTKGLKIVVEIAKMFYPNLKANILSKEVLNKAKEVFYKDVKNCSKENFSVYKDSNGEYGLDYLISYNGNITTWGNYQRNNIPNIYIDNYNFIQRKLYEDIISYSFINMSYNEIDSIVRDVNVSAADRAIGINVRDFSGAYLLQENHTALYYAIFLIKKFLNENILTKHEIQDLSQELAKIVKLDISEIKNLYFESDYCIFSQLMESNFDNEEWTDVFELIDLGHYFVSDENLIKAKQYYQNLNTLCKSDDKTQYSRLLNRLCSMSIKAFNFIQKSKIEQKNQNI